MRCPADHSQSTSWRFVLLLWAGVLASLAVLLPAARAQTGPGEGKEGLVELGKHDPRLKGHFAPPGFKVQIIAAEPTIIDPTGMAFDDQGQLYVAEWAHANRMLDTWETLQLPEGGTTKVLHRRKTTTDIVKRLRDTNGDGIYDRAEVVVDGAEMPSSIFPWKNSLYLTCSGRLERWSDEDGDGTFELKTVLAEGFCAFYHHWLSGMTLNADGWFYLTAGDNDNHVVGSDGSRVEVSRCGGVFRGKIDGSQMHLFALGFRNPYRNLAFNSTFDPFLVDNDNEDGSKFQGCRLIKPVEEGDYGWRLYPGAPCCRPDFDRGAVNGELPGKLPIITKTGRGAPAGLIVYNGVALPDRYRDLVIYADVFRKLVRGYRVKPQGGANVLDKEVTLMTADDDLFRPCQAVVGADGALYILDWRSNSGGAGRLWGDRKYGRIYKLTWEGDSQTPALPLNPNNWKRVQKASDPQLFSMLRSKDYEEARRALRELVGRGEVQRLALLELINAKDEPLHVRLLGLQGARQLWNDTVEKAMLAALDDPAPELRRLAAQALSWEPKERRPGLVPALVAHLNDPDGRVLRDIALAIGRHGWSVPFDAAPTLFAWLLAHPQADVVVRDAFIRALERLGDPGVEEIAQAIRTRCGSERAAAVALYTALRTEPAARRLPALATLRDLTGNERLALVRLFKDIPLNISVPTQGLADWIAAHPEMDSAVKVAALDVCRLAGNPAAALVVGLLDDRDESVRLAATRLAAESDRGAIRDRLKARLVNPATSLRERTALALTLRNAGPKAFGALESAYQKFTGDAGFRKVALRALADVDRLKARPLAEAALAADVPELRSEAVQILGESPQSALALGRAYLDHKLGRDDLPAVLAALRKYNGADHLKLLNEIQKEAARGVISAPALKEKVEKGANPWNGLNVYLRETGLRCFTCHKIENVGGNIGPSLTGVYQALSVDKMIESMLEPSKEIKEGYEPYKVALKDGRVLNGIKVAQDNRTLVLKDANGQETRIPTGDIDEAVRDTVSIMPLGLVQEYAPEELADLIAFLRSKPAQEALRVRQRLDHFLAIGPFAPGEKSRLPLDRVETSRSYPGQDGQTVSWLALDSSSGGTVDLRGHYGPHSGRAFLATRIHSKQAQDAALRFGLGGTGQIYLNGKELAHAPARGRAREGSDLTHLPLQAGWNTLIVAVDRAVRGDDRATFEILAAQPLDVRTNPGADRG